MNPQLVNNGVKEMMYGTPYTYKGLAAPVDQRGLSTPMMYAANETLQLKITQYPGPNPLPAGFRYTHLILADNGYLYSFPLNQTGQMLKLDPNTGTFTQFGSMGIAAQFRGGLRSFNGKLYGIPATSPFIAIVDTTTDSITTIGSFGLAGSKWNGGVLAPNGKIYCPPGTETSILIIDTNNDTFSNLGVFPSSVSPKWACGVLAPNGKIYCIPSNEVNRRILVIDPKDDTFYFLDSLNNYGPPNRPTSTLYLSATLAMNNKIYAFGFNVAGVLEISPENDSIRYIPVKGFTDPYRTAPYFTLSENSGLFSLASTCGALATNGKIYFTNGSIPSVVNLNLEELSPYEFDVQTETLNRIYGSAVPSLSNILIDRTYIGGGGSIDRDGNLWIIYPGAQCILKVSGFPPATPDMYQMPPAAQLATSLYSKFHNKMNAST